MKKLLIFLGLFVFTTHAYSQLNLLDRSTSLMNYGQYIHPYIKLKHESNYKGELDSLKKDYLFLISFNVDTFGILVNYKIKSDEKIPELVKSYIQKLIYTTSGSWLPEIKNNKLVLSSNIICQVSLSRKIDFNKIYSRETKLDDINKLLENFKPLKENGFIPNQINYCFFYLTF